MKNELKQLSKESEILELINSKTNNSINIEDFLSFYNNLNKDGNKIKFDTAIEAFKRIQTYKRN